MADSFVPPEDSPTREELLAEARRLVHVAAGTTPGVREVSWVDGRAVVRRALPPSLPDVGSPEWWAAPSRTRIASLLVLAEAQLVADPDRQMRERLRQVSQAISSGMDWSETARHMSYAELERRRAEPGPNARQVDRGSLVRWVESGSSEPETRHGKDAA